METNQVCENYAKCPVFSGVLEGMEMTARNYKRQYCEAGPKGYESCKRYIVKVKTGQCPPNLLPNSLKSIDEIIASM